MDKRILSAGYEFGSACDAGRKRKDEPNQDAVELVLPDGRYGDFPPLLLVADGMGGHLGGALASQLVIDVFREQYVHFKHPASYPKLLDLCVKKAHDAVRVRGAQDPRLSSMGSTVVAIVIHDRRVHLLNVGDSRAYIFRGEKSIQISQDQSWVEEQVRAGLLTPEQARGHPKRNRLNMSITAKRTSIQPFSIEFALEPNDIILLCSDGLWSTIPESLIWAAVNELPPQEAADKLVSLANSSQGPDNISVVIARPAGFTKMNRSAVQLDDTQP
jgi:serine/threonine protein phosphatase PrpC